MNSVQFWQRYAEWASHHPQPYDPRVAREAFGMAIGGIVISMVDALTPALARVQEAFTRFYESLA